MLDSETQLLCELPLLKIEIDSPVSKAVTDARGAFFGTLDRPPKKYPFSSSQSSLGIEINGFGDNFVWCVSVRGRA